jgi:GMP synthase (glutamine-hydrolysing)
VTDLAPTAPIRGQAGPDRPAGPARPLLVVMHEDDAGPGRLTAGLPELDIRRPYAGDPLPDDLADHAGLLVLGGAMGALDDEAAPWLPDTRRLMALAADSGVPTLGICLGAQLLAAATGGRVERGGAGLEVGLVRVRLLPAAAEDPLLAGPAADPGFAVAQSDPGFAVAQWHQDAVVELPPGAVLLATGERYPHQAFRLGERAWGLQYHPEVTLADFGEWMQGGHGAVRAHGLLPENVLGELAAADAELDRVAALHSRAFAAQLAGRPTG